MTDHEVMQLALEVLEFYQHRCNQQGFYSVNKQPLPIKAITQLRNQLAKPQGEWVRYNPNTATYNTPDGTCVPAELADNVECLADVVNISQIRELQRTSTTPKVVPQGESVALETVYETIIAWDEGGKRSRRELARRIAALYTTPPDIEAAIKYREIYEEAVFEATKEKAAKVCEGVNTLAGYDLAAAIRSMK